MSTNTIQQVINGIIKHGPEILEHCVLENCDQYIERLRKEFLNYPKPKKEIDKNNWFMPDSYKSMDIEKFILDQCKTQEEIRQPNRQRHRCNRRRLPESTRQGC